MKAIPLLPECLTDRSVSRITYLNFRCGARQLLWFFILAAVCAELSAQPVVTINRFINRWPDIQIYYNVTCNGQRLFTEDTTKIAIHENGERISPVDIDCVDSTVHCPLSVVLVIQWNCPRTSRVGCIIAEAAKAFIIRMDGISDEAAIIWHSSNGSALDRPMTSDTGSLVRAIDSCPGSLPFQPPGGCLRGVIAAATTGRNPCKAVIVFDSRWPIGEIFETNQIIPYAIDTRVRVCEAVFYPDTIVPLMQPRFPKAVRETGGKMAFFTQQYWYNVPRDSVGYVDEVRSWATWMRQSFQECRATFSETCSDGTLRDISLIARDQCGGTASATVQVRAPSNAVVSFEKMYFRLLGGTSRAPDTVALPFLIASPPSSPRNFGPFSFTLTVDTTRLQFLGIDTPPWTIFHGLTLHKSDSSGVVIFRCDESRKIDHAGILAILRFRVRYVEVAQAYTPTIRWSYLYGCINPQQSHDPLVIEPPVPALVCSMSAPDVIVIDTRIRDYSPNPIEIRATVKNIGEERVKNLSARLRVDTTVIASSALDQAFPSNPLFPSGSSTVVWSLTLKHRDSPAVDTLRVDIMQGNDVVRQCEYLVHVPAIAPEIHCSMHVPSVTIDTARAAYDRMRISLFVVNSGLATARNVNASLYLPDGLRLVVQGNQNHQEQPLPTSMLKSGDTDSVSWLVEIQPGISARRFEVSASIQAENADTARCSDALVTPRMVPRLFLTPCSTVVGIDTAAGCYSPLPFVVSVAIENLGIEPADSAIVTLDVPAGAALAGSDTGPRTKGVSGTHLSAGGRDSIRWQVTHPPVTRDSSLRVSFSAMALNGKRVNATGVVRLPGLAPELRFSCDTPPVIMQSDLPRQDTSNCFTVTLDCRNQGTAPADSVIATIMLPNDVEREIPSDPLTMMFAPTVIPTWQSGIVVKPLRWRLRYVGTATRPTPLTFGYDISAKNQIDGSALAPAAPMCRSITEGDTSRTYFFCSLLMPDSLTWHGGAMSPDPVVIGMLAVNHSEKERVITEVELKFPPHQIDSTDDATPLKRPLSTTLLPGDSLRFNWIVHVRREDQSRILPVAVVTRFGAADSLLCTGALVVEGAQATLACSVRGSTSRLTFDPVRRRYEPSSWEILCELRNVGNETLSQIAVEILHTERNGLDLVELDPMFPDNSNPKSLARLAPDSMCTLSWGFRLFRNEALSDTGLVRFRIRYSSAQTPASGDCECSLSIDPANVLSAEEIRGPSVARILLNRPNPFNAETMIEYETIERGRVDLFVVDMLGRRVATLVDALVEPGRYRVRFDAAKLASGLYYSVLVTLSNTVRAGMVVTK